MKKIYELALKNLKNFYYVINFDNYESDLKKMFEKLNLDIKHNYLKAGTSHSKTNLTDLDEKRIIAKKYNYWDVKLYNEFLKFKNS